MLPALCACTRKPAERKPTDVPEAKIFITVNTEGMGNIDTIEQKESDSEATRWLISGQLDTDTLTVSYTGSQKSKLAYDAGGEIRSEEPAYEDGSGTVVFHVNGSFTGHEDRAADAEERVFEWLPVTHAIENP